MHVVVKCAFVYNYSSHCGVYEDEVVNYSSHCGVYDLSTQNTPIHIMVLISFSVYAIQLL